MIFMYLDDVLILILMYRLAVEYEEERRERKKVEREEKRAAKLKESASSISGDGMKEEKDNTAVNQSKIIMRIR